MSGTAGVKAGSTRERVFFLPSTLKKAQKAEFNIAMAHTDNATSYSAVQVCLEEVA